MPVTIQNKFVTTRKELAASLIERDEEIDLALTAMVCKQHCLFVSPPGCAKSLLCQTLASWLDSRPFIIQLSKFTMPEEMFGPISVSGLKSDVYRRIPTGKLPEAYLAVFEEIWNASSAIINTLQMAMNERQWQNNGHLETIPLISVTAASNRWPNADDNMDAVFDRFLFRKAVKPISTQRGLNALLWNANLTPSLSTRITPAEIETAHNDAHSMPWRKEAQEAFVTIVGDARREGISAGDRRLRQSVNACQSFAWLSGASEVAAEHLEILSATLWSDPTEQPRKLAEIVGKIANPQGMQVTALLGEAEQIISSVDYAKAATLAAATSKLVEVSKKLGAMTTPRAATAKAHVDEQLQEIKVNFVKKLPG